MVRGVNKLTDICGCPVLFYLNNKEISISIFNIRLKKLALNIKPETWWLYEVLAVKPPMKRLNAAVYQHKKYID